MGDRRSAHHVVHGEGVSRSRQRHARERPVTTVLYTHSHTDHYGGILGVTSTDEVDKGNVRILAPEGFMRRPSPKT